jgi:ABC-type sugar transport system permease subunit
LANILSVEGAEPAAQAGVKGWFARRTQTEGGIATFFVGPALLLMVLLNIYPILHSFYVSVHVYNLKRPHRNPFVGFENYVMFLESEDFYNAFTNTIVFVVVSVIAVALLGLIFALALNELGSGVRKWAVPLILVPWAVPYVANGLIWEWIYHSDYGVLNGLLVSLGIIEKYQTWLSNPNRALYTLVNAFVWKEVPLATVLILTALQAIPEDLYSAAKVDQAGASRRFWHITLPALKLAFLLVLVYSSIISIKTFDLIYILTEGGPGDATALVSWYTYVETFRNLQFGSGAAISYVIAIATFILAIGYIKILYRPQEG